MGWELGEDVRIMGAGGIAEVAATAVTLVVTGGTTETETEVAETETEVGGIEAVIEGLTVEATETEIEIEIVATEAVIVVTAPEIETVIAADGSVADLVLDPLLATAVKCEARLGLARLGLVIGAFSLLGTREVIKW
jgi:hypothetical protein